MTWSQQESVYSNNKTYDLILIKEAEYVTSRYSFIIVSSSQSNMRWFDSEGSPHWQCSSAPSSVVNKTYFFGHVNII